MGFHLECTHRRLLETDPRQRLGSAGGADEVMSHPWFEAVDWAKTAKVRVSVAERWAIALQAKWCGRACFSWGLVPVREHRTLI